MSFPDHQSQSSISGGLDEALTQLADILRAIGVEEMSVNDHYQHHIINTDVVTDKALVNTFCSLVRQLHVSLQAGK